MNAPNHARNEVEDGVWLDCGWGRLLFAHTCADPNAVVRSILNESPGRRDIAFYLTDPHVVLSLEPQRLFLDPSHTYRIRFEDYRKSEREVVGFSVAPLQTFGEIEEINRIYRLHDMVPVDSDIVWKQREDPRSTYVLARDERSGSVFGVALGVDHQACFEDIENGSSLWSLAVDPQVPIPGVGEALVRYLIEWYQARGRSQLDLSVIYTNEGAIALYEKLGFRRASVFAVKVRNSINESLFIGDSPCEGYNPYAKIIIDEALRRGIAVIPLDPPRGYFRLQLGGSKITCRESLSELTSAVAMSRCDDKALTRSILQEAGLQVPAQVDWTNEADGRQFLKQHQRVVVKPVRGEQGAGISVDLRTEEELFAAVTLAATIDERVILEQYVEGKDLRIIVIHGAVVAAAVRRPPTVVGTGRHTVRQLIESASRRREASTGGESRIPMDSETLRCVRLAGFEMEDALPEGERLEVRKTANLHTGGTIHDVTSKLSQTLGEAAVAAAQVLEIPVVGFDFLVSDVQGSTYVIIEANERPGLANHEPAPTAERFVDFLFPQTAECVRRQETGSL
jgi:GNAT-family acetyltransferase (TIGR03103 family)